MKRYSPLLYEEAEKLYKAGEYSECIQIAMDAHQKACLDAEEEWQELIKGPPSELARMTEMWDTTTRKYLKYEDYIKSHDWHDDIPPAPLNLAEKAKRKLKKT